VQQVQTAVDGSAGQAVGLHPHLEAGVPVFQDIQQVSFPVP
jgi:hypothetical protein